MRLIAIKHFNHLSALLCMHWCRRFRCAHGHSPVHRIPGLSLVQLNVILTEASSPFGVLEITILGTARVGLLGAGVAVVMATEAGMTFAV